MDYQKVFDNGKLLFEYFGWYSLLLVFATTLLMLPLNILYKKIMKKDALDRLRKSVSGISVYVVALALVFVFTYFVVKAPITVEYLVSASLSCGLLSMLLWAVIKFVRDYGFIPLFNSIAKSKEAKKWIKDLGISEKVINLINDNIKVYMKDEKIVSFDDYMKNEAIIINQVKTQVMGFVTNDKVNDVVNNIVAGIKTKIKKEEK